MPLYYEIDEQGAIVSGPRVLPTAWRNISGLHLLPDDRLNTVGWLPEVRQGDDPYDPATQVKSGPQLIVGADVVTAIYTVRSKTPQEIDDEKQLRVDSYDPLSLDVLFDHENRLRALELRPLLTVEDFKQLLRGKIRASVR